MDHLSSACAGDVLTDSLARDDLAELTVEEILDIEFFHLESEEEGILFVDSDGSHDTLLSSSPGQDLFSQCLDYAEVIHQSICDFDESDLALTPFPVVSEASASDRDLLQSDMPLFAVYSSGQSGSVSPHSIRNTRFRHDANAFVGTETSGSLTGPLSARKRKRLYQDERDSVYKEKQEVISHLCRQLRIQYPSLDDRLDRSGRPDKAPACDIKSPKCPLKLNEQLASHVPTTYHGGVIRASTTEGQPAALDLRTTSKWRDHPGEPHVDSTQSSPASTPKKLRPANLPPTPPPTPSHPCTCLYPASCPYHSCCQ